MIGRLRGTLISRQPPWLLVDVGGVGYELQAPMSTVYELPPTGNEVVLLTHQVSRDDAVALYGFSHESERTLFRNLLKVSGIGAKIALAVLSGVSSDEFARLVNAGDAQALTRIPGIGKKTAERMLVEMRDRVDQLGVRLPAAAGGGAGHPADAQGEALVALQQLGYKPAEAQRLVSKAAAEGDTAETIIRKALRAAIGA
ncbi:MAG: Holliday junction branch migration protein RuvA [Rhodanobacteraceae bacterium]